MRIVVNNREYRINVDRDTPLLWVIREHLRLTGTKFGCLKGLCGSCSVLVDGELVRSCMISVGEVENKEIITVEGIPENHPVKIAWKRAGVPQCGFCQSGQIITAYYLLSKNRNPSRREIVEFMNGNLCRCGTYPRIIKAIELASKMMR